MAEPITYRTVHLAAIVCPHCGHHDEEAINLEFVKEPTRIRCTLCDEPILVSFEPIPVFHARAIVGEVEKGEGRGHG